MSRLTLRYRYDPSFDAEYFGAAHSRDDFGRLSLSVETEGQSGRGGFWVQWQDVVEFGEALATYPIALDEPLSASWGYNACDGDDLIVGITIGSKDGLGGLLVSVEIADDHENWKRVRTTFETDYPALEAFRVDLARLMAREGDEAVLAGH